MWVEKFELVVVSTAHRQIHCFLPAAAAGLRNLLLGALEKALVFVEWAGGRVIHLSRPFFSLRNVCDLTSLSDPWALCLLLQVRVGALQFSSAPRLEFPLDSFSSQQEVKAKIKRMVFKYV